MSGCERVISSAGVLDCSLVVKSNVSRIGQSLDNSVNSLCGSSVLSSGECALNRGELGSVSERNKVLLSTCKCVISSACLFDCSLVVDCNGSGVRQSLDHSVNSLSGSSVLNTGESALNGSELGSVSERNKVLLSTCKCVISSACLFDCSLVVDCNGSGVRQSLDHSVNSLSGSSVLNTGESALNGSELGSVNE